MRLYSTLPRLFGVAPPKAGAANVPRMERARRPPKAENRTHIPRAIASREAMLWQGCSLSPRELERKAPRSVWATQLPASRPIRWIVRESREANRTDFARIPSDGLRDAPRASTDGLARIRKADADSTISQPRYGRNQPPLNHEPSFVSNPRTIPTQPYHIRDSTTPTASSTTTQPQPNDG